MDIVDDELERRARDFAAELTDVVRAVAQPPCPPLVALAVPGARDAFTIRQDGSDSGLALHVNGQRLLTVTLFYRCSWDRRGAFLALESSAVKVIAGSNAGKEPLFRYEYLRRPHGDIPAAHLQVHAHRDALTWLMTRGDRHGDGRLRSLQDLHFPLGGSRFRPCLEDVLEMLITEFGVEPATDDGRERLARGRLRWRDMQVRSAVRDNPPAAAAALRDLGYSVIDPPDGPAQADEARLRLI